MAPLPKIAYTSDVHSRKTEFLGPGALPIGSWLALVTRSPTSPSFPQGRSPVTDHGITRQRFIGSFAESFFNARGPYFSGFCWNFVRHSLQQTAIFLPSYCAYSGFPTKPTILSPETGQIVFTAASDAAALALAVGLGSVANTLTVSAASNTAISSFFIFDLISLACSPEPFHGCNL
jgi:hypothetical protein